MNIKKGTFDFLKKLKDNNSKEWFDLNRDNYEASRQNVIEFIDAVLNELSKKDPSIKGQMAKSCLFRINRDVRFSKNKQPYKTNFGASINMEGRKSPKAGYYIHIEPNASFIGGGIYMPDGNLLSKLRQEIDYNSKAFHKILSNKNFKHSYEDLWLEDSLAQPPRGYDKTHPDIKYLKLKSYIATRDITDAHLIEMPTKEWVKHLSNLTPLIHFLNSVFD
jgi:uncharacterized protein (TIGR02453 family)